MNFHLVHDKRGDYLARAITQYFQEVLERLHLSVEKAEQKREDDTDIDSFFLLSE